MTLYTVTGKNSFCGPSAISAITGVTTDEASKAIRGFPGKRATFGVHPRHMIMTLEEMGYTVLRVVDLNPLGTRKLTLARFCKRYNRNNPDIAYLLIVGPRMRPHYMVTSGRKAVDSGAYGSRVPQFLKEFGKRRAQVNSAWEVFKASK